MKEVVGRVFSIARDNEPIAGCTVSKEIYGGDNAISIFSMAEDTDISAEICPRRDQGRDGARGKASRAGCADIG